MIRYENLCVDCGLPCRHDACPYYKVKICYCDVCNDKAIFEYNGKHYCEGCLHPVLNEEFDELDIWKKIEILALEDEITEV